MADSIATQAGKLLREFSETMENLQRLQSVTAECRHIEDMQDTWLLREHFMTLAAAQWDQLSDMFIKDVLPFVIDLKKGVHHVKVAG